MSSVSGAKSDVVRVAVLPPPSLSAFCALRSPPCANLQLGADTELLTSVLQQPADVAASLKEAAGAPEGFEVVIDCAGFEQTMQVGAAV